MQEFARVNEQIKVKNNYDTEEKFLLDIINDIFDFSSHQSVLKIGKNIGDMKGYGVWEWMCSKNIVKKCFYP